MQYAYLLTDNTLTVFIAGREYSTDRSNPAWEQIKKKVRQPTVIAEELIELLKPINALAKALVNDGNLVVRNGFVFYEGEGFSEKIHDSLSKRLLDVMSEGFDITPWKKFVRNLYANPAKFAQQELYDWLENSDLPLTPDGCFLAYKIVKNDYTDIYTGRFDNSVGKVVEMPRDNVDTVRTNTRSRGLHFCSKGYLGSYGTGPGSRVVIVKVNPADVVSIPVDYNFAKGRTWKYEVVGEVTREAAPDIRWNAVDTDFSNWDSDYDEDEEFSEEYLAGYQAGYDEGFEDGTDTDY